MFQALLIVLFVPAVDAEVTADVIIRGATIHDGSGKPGFRGDVALKGERIVGVGQFAVSGQPEIIDGTGLIVAPGFIDLHNHSDMSAQRPRILRPAIAELEYRKNLNFLMQGCTTIVTGNCGFGPYDVAEFFRQLDKNKIGTNVIHQIPHNDLRQHVMGNANRPPTDEEMARMLQLVEKNMKDGAWGLSTGLFYTPGSYADKDEIVALAKVVSRYGGFYASHMRNEGPNLLPSIHETIEVGRRAKLPVHISHFKAFGPKAWGKAADAIALVRDARKKGLRVTVDQYPYTASSTSLAADVIPQVYREGSHKDLIARFDDPELGPKIRQAIQSALKDMDDGKRIRIAQFPANPKWQGKDLAQLAKEQGKNPVDIVLDIERRGGCQIVAFSMTEEDVRLIMKQPFVATASDGATKIPDATVPHPRNYGTFPRKIGYYALQERVLPVEQAIRSATGLPADILKLPQRGYLKPGYFADVVVFDPKTFRDTATFDKPHQYATGVRYLFVNGVATIKDGKYTGALAGKALRHSSR
ncbi:MAG: aminoacylase [Gemmatales bacterium]|nr:MAG: aminoacylase [Gemmatales bacterium]